MIQRLVILLSVVLSSTLFAAGGNFGIGGIIGEPTGLAFKLKMGQKKAIDGALAIGVIPDRSKENNENTRLYFRASHLWLFPDFIPSTNGLLPLYVGAGGRLRAISNFNLGVRGSAGLVYMPETAPIDIFLDIGIIVDFLGRIDTDIDAGFGLRVFF